LGHEAPLGKNTGWTVATLRRASPSWQERPVAYLMRGRPARVGVYVHCCSKAMTTLSWRRRRPNPLPGTNPSRRRPWNLRQIRGAGAEHVAPTLLIKHVLTRPSVARLSSALFAENL